MSLNALISLRVQRDVDFVKSFTNNLARAFANARLQKMTVLVRS